MCGIAGIYLNNPHDTALPPEEEREAFINALLKGIESRGRHATGVVAVQRASTQPHLEKADVEASKFIEWRRPLPEASRIVLCHTRAATKGSPTNLDNNHPVVHKSCFVTHNGHISNDDDLFESFKLERFAEVDSEAIPALIDKFGLDKVHLALQELLGGFAIAAIQPEKNPDVLVLAKGTNSPLEYMETEQGLIWASTRSAMQDAWAEVWGKKPTWDSFQSLKEGELLYIEDGKIEKLEFKVKPRPQRTWTPSSSYSGASSYTRLRNDEHVHRKLCGCSHSQWMHSGSNCEGFCIKSDCRCTKFKQQSYMGKKAWRKHPECIRIKSERSAEAERNKRLKEAEALRQKTHPLVKPHGVQVAGGIILPGADDGPLKILYVNGERKTYHGNKLVAVEFKCDGCTEYRDPKGKARMGAYTLCVECWGDECDGCNSFYNPDDLTKVGVEDANGVSDDWYLCKECYDVMNTEPEVENADACQVIIPGLAKGKIDGLPVDNLAIKLAAEELECKAAFLYELLFELTEEEIGEETWLTHAYVLSKAKYLTAIQELKQGLPEATARALREPKSPSEAAEQGGESPIGVKVFADE